MKSEIVLIVTMMMLRSRVSSFACRTITQHSHSSRIIAGYNVNIGGETSRHLHGASPTKSAVRSFMQTRRVLGPNTNNGPKISAGKGGDDDGWWEDSDASAGSSAASNAGPKPSWADRNQKFENQQDYATKQQKKVVQKEKDDFQSTRVWVQDIPLDANWQDLKDHFRIAGDVVYASVSTDKHTQESKGVGVVQYETVDEAKKAIKMMRDHPLVTSSTGSQGAKLYVREDYQEQRRGSSININYRGKKKNKVTAWTCANDDAADEELAKNVLTVLEARDEARKRKSFIASDAMRDQLKDDYNVHIDDRMKLWWTHFDGDETVPSRLTEMKGEGKWGEVKTKPWRQIPTIPEQDALVDPSYVQRLLSQRDRARRRKEFDAADNFLDQARTAPTGDVFLRIHDDSRTWRIWTEAPPPRQEQEQDQTEYRQPPKRPPRTTSSNDNITDSGKNVVDQCMDLVEKYDPDKSDEIRLLLAKFPGREYNILNKLKDRYSQL